MTNNYPITGSAYDAMAKAISDLNRKLGDFPVVFLSYNEPNAETNFEHLERTLAAAGKAPPLRVSGVKGFDAAHKTAAALAKKDAEPATHFYTVDGDTQVDPAFWATPHTLKDLPFTLPNSPCDFTYSWRSINSVNRLAYGNGGLKLWSHAFVNTMVTHEAATEGDPVVDFCWDSNYIQMHAVVGTTYIDGSAYQAWRAGFREGVKLLLQHGKPIDLSRWRREDNETNVRRLLQWLTVGADSAFGLYAMAGASAGFTYAHIEGGDLSVVQDYDKLFDRYKEDSSLEYVINERHTQRLAEIKTFLGVAIPRLGAQQSQLVKMLITHEVHPIVKQETWQWL